MCIPPFSHHFPPQKTVLLVFGRKKKGACVCCGVCVCGCVTCWAGDVIFFLLCFELLNCVFDKQQHCRSFERPFLVTTMSTPCRRKGTEKQLSKTNKISVLDHVAIRCKTKNKNGGGGGCAFIREANKEVESANASPWNGGTQVLEQRVGGIFFCLKTTPKNFFCLLFASNKMSRKTILLLVGSHEENSRYIHNSCSLAGPVFFRLNKKEKKTRKKKKTVKMERRLGEKAEQKKGHIFLSSFFFVTSTKKKEG